jgi:hypothetical protein
VGTGFFITNYGVFATAKHVVIDEKTGQVSENLYAVHTVRRAESMFLRRLTRVDVHGVSDVAVGVLEAVTDVQTHERMLNRARDPESRRVAGGRVSRNADISQGRSR